MLLVTAVALLSVKAFAHEIELSDRGLSVVIESVSGAPNSDAVAEVVEIRNAGGRVVAQLPPLLGPIHVSNVNGQIFSCESNAQFGTESAKVFDLKGRLSFSFRHRGFLRACGVTGDSDLYWLHYNAVRGRVPLSVLVVLDSEGAVVAEADSEAATQLEFSHGTGHYTLPVPEPQFPG